MRDTSLMIGQNVCVDVACFISGRVNGCLPIRTQILIPTAITRMLNLEPLEHLRIIARYHIEMLRRLIQDSLRFLPLLLIKSY